MNGTLEDIVTSEIKPLGLELFELKLGGSKGRPVVDVRIEREDGEKVTVEDCADASRAIETRLDEQDFGGRQYVLEVSSPGVERPLRWPEHWRRFVGRRARVRAEPLGGRRDVEIVGVPDDEHVILRGEDGTEVTVTLAQVREATLVVDWGAQKRR